ncbi:MAG: MFS transporter [Candidatus Curtissbacteria bacterium]|nr:MFS transporter [Candidatus Curtissbacteria bacterium]
MQKDDFTVEEELEVTAATGGSAPIPLPGKVISIFPAFAHRNFQLYFAGQAISIIGFWLHQVAVGWLSFQLTNSAFWVGAVAAATGLPILFFTTFAGVIIDKVDKKKLLIVTQVTEGILAIILGLLVYFSLINLPLLILLSFLIGTVAAIDLPTRLTYMVEMVGKKDLASAIPINNSLFNGARFIGPAIAGALIVKTGLAMPFILNGLSFIAGILAIIAVKPVYIAKSEANIHPLESLKAGLKYSFGHPKILYFLILGTLSAICIWPYQTLMPIVAERVYHSGAQGYGSLLSSAGLGGFLGAIYTSSRAKSANKGRFIFYGMMVSSVTFILFAINRNFVLAHVLLFVSGFGLILQTATLNTLVQLNSPDGMRGRIMAVYLTMFVGMIPLGNFIMGYVAEKTNAMFVIGVGGAIVFLVGVYFYFRGIFSKFSA